eukprot:Opistho-2@93455
MQADRDGYNMHMPTTFTLDTRSPHDTNTWLHIHTIQTDKVLLLHTDCAYPSANASSACSPIRVHPTHKIKIHQSPPDQPPVKQHAPRLHVAVHIAGRVETQQGLERIAQKAQAHYRRSFGRRGLRIEPVHNQPVLAPITTTWHVCTQRHNRVVVRKLEQNRNFKLTPPALHHNGKVGDLPTDKPRTCGGRLVDFSRRVSRNTRRPHTCHEEPFRVECASGAAVTSSDSAVAAGGCKANGEAILVPIDTQLILLGQWCLLRRSATRCILACRVALSLRLPLPRACWVLMAATLSTAALRIAGPGGNRCSRTPRRFGCGCC